MIALGSTVAYTRKEMHALRAAFRATHRKSGDYPYAQLAVDAAAAGRISLGIVEETDATILFIPTLPAKRRDVLTVLAVPRIGHKSTPRPTAWAVVRQMRSDPPGYVIICTSAVGSDLVWREAILPNIARLGFMAIVYCEREDADAWVAAIHDVSQTFIVAGDLANV